VSVVDSGCPASTRPHCGYCCGVRFRRHLLGCASGPRSRRTATVQTLQHWPRLVDTGRPRRPALRTPAPAAASCRPHGNATLDSWQRNRPPPPHVRPGTEPQSCGSGRHPRAAITYARRRRCSLRGQRPREPNHSSASDPDAQTEPQLGRHMRAREWRGYGHVSRRSREGHGDDHHTRASSTLTMVAADLQATQRRGSEPPHQVSVPLRPLRDPGEGLGSKSLHLLQPDD
jgi:hypothetical protein